MPTLREIYMSHLPQHSKAARPWDYLAGHQGVYPRNPPAFSGYGGMGDFDLSALTDAAMAKLREEAGRGAEEQVGPIVKMAIGLSAAAIGLSAISLVLQLRPRR